jgi:hypothetical protein
VAVHDAIEGELENVLTRQKSVQQGLNDAVAKGNEILKGFADIYKESMAHLPAERDPLGLSGHNHEVVVP